MSEQVTAFWPVQSGVFDYLFFVTNLNDYSSTISRSLEDNLEIFGSDLALKGKVIEAYSRAKWETFKEITDKESWPEKVKGRFEREQFPFMLVINKDFQEFNPNEHHWSVIWFSDFRDDPDSIPIIFSNLVRKIKQNINLFEYLSGLSRDAKTKDFSEYFEIKPGIFGVSVDVKAILLDIGKAIRDRIDK